MSNEYKDWLKDQEEEQNQVLVLLLDFDKMSAEEGITRHDKLQEEFPNIKMVTLPYSSSFTPLDKKLLIGYLKEVIKELEEE